MVVVVAITQMWTLKVGEAVYVNVKEAMYVTSTKPRDWQGPHTQVRS